MISSYQYPALAAKISAPVPTKAKRMNAGTNFLRSVWSQWRAAMTPHNHSTAPILAASRSSQVNPIPLNWPMPAILSIGGQCGQHQ